jgi:hypothetical protein
MAVGFLVSLYSAQEGNSFRNVVKCCVITMEKVEKCICDETYASPVSEMHMIQLQALTFCNGGYNNIFLHARTVKFTNNVKYVEVTLNWKDSAGLEVTRLQDN